MNDSMTHDAGADLSTGTHTDRTAPSPSTTRPPESEDGRLHIYLKRDAAFAKPLGLDVQMLCGVWGPPTGRGKGWTPEQQNPKHCPECIAVAAAYDALIEATR